MLPNHKDYKKMLWLRQQGATNVEISKRFNVSRERVRQILGTYCLEEKNTIINRRKQIKRAYKKFLKISNELTRQKEYYNKLSAMYDKILNGATYSEVAQKFGYASGPAACQALRRWAIKNNYAWPLRTVSVKKSKAKSRAKSKKPITRILAPIT